MLNGGVVVLLLVGLHLSTFAELRNQGKLKKRIIQKTCWHQHTSIFSGGK